jgi:hypothetical protein
VLGRQPVLEGELVCLRPLRTEDWEALFAVASDPLIWAQHPAHDRWQEPVFRAFFDDALANKGALAVIDAQTGSVIGSSRFQGLEQAGGGSVEIGWTFLARSHWGGRYNHEMKRLMQPRKLMASSLMQPSFTRSMIVRSGAPSSSIAASCRSMTNAACMSATWWTLLPSSIHLPRRSCP